MAVIEIARIQVRRGQENQTGVPTLAGGEFGWAADTEHLYIGLRREDGGSRDENVRILTENDLDNFFDSSLTNTGEYIYRESSKITADPTDITETEYKRLVITKLDEFVSVKDFGVVGLGGVSDDWLLLQRAIDGLFLTTSTFNPSVGVPPSKVLLFPTGVYNIANPLYLPPHTTLIGEGIGKTIINLTSAATHAFITVDGRSGMASAGDIPITFEVGIGSDLHQPNYIHIEGMTVQYDSDLTTGMADCLLSLDCSENAVIRKVRFAGTVTEYSGALGAGYSGIDIRGYGATLASSENVLIDNCEFDGLYHCVKSNYDIVNPIIQNSKFSNSVRGVSFNNPKEGTADIGPRYGRIVNNRFENIHQQAVYAGATSSNTGTNHISMNNQFYNVGNLGGGRDSSTGTAVITYLTDGNISVNDFFDRQEWQNQNISTAQQYFPLVEGKATLDSVGVNTSVLFASTATMLLRLPVTSDAQQLNIKYNVVHSGLTDVDRMGVATFNIPQGTTPNVSNYSDNYTYNTGDGAISWGIFLDAYNKFYEIYVNNSQAFNQTIEYQTKLMI